MRRGNQTSSRKRFFQDLGDIGYGDEHPDAMQHLDGQMNNLQESVYDNVQLGNRMSSRRRFFQNLNHEEASGVSITFGNKDGNTSEQMDEPMRNLGRSANHNMHLGSRKSLRNIYFQQLDNEGTVGTSETFESEQNDNLSSFGQAHYQRQKQGIIIEYKDFRDNTFQCIHCGAYYWRDEENAHGVYTGCCKQGQVRLS